MKRLVAVVLCFFMTMAMLSGCGQPADNGDGLDGYPSKSIGWIVPAAAGAAIDLPSRVLADLLDLGSAVVIENIAGASQTIGTTEAKMRAADGYTLLTMANACGVTQPVMNNELAYSVDDFRNICLFSPGVATCIAVKADSEIKDAEDWLEYIKSNTFNCGIPNAGSVGQLAVSSAFKQLGVYDSAKLITYSGSAEMAAAIINGEIEFAPFDTTDVVSKVASGEFRAIVVLFDERNEALEGVPAISEYGLKNMGAFMGLKWIAVHKDTPDTIVEYLKEKINAGIASEEYQKYLSDNGLGSLEIMSEEDLTKKLTEIRAEVKNIMVELGMAAQ